MRVAQYYAVAAAAVLCGIAIVAGVRLDVSLVAAHPYLNLLGWGSMGLCGLYYCSPGPVLRPRLAWTQAAAAALGFVAITGGLAAFDATGDGRFAALAALGALLAVAGMILLLAQLLDGGRHARGASTYA